MVCKLKSSQGFAVLIYLIFIVIFRFTSKTNITFSNNAFSGLHPNSLMFDISNPNEEFTIRLGENATIRKFSYKASKPSTINYLSLEGVKVIDEIVLSNITINTLEISSCEINKIRTEAPDVKVTNVLKIQNNVFKEVESNAFKKLR